MERTTRLLQNFILAAKNVRRIFLLPVFLAPLLCIFLFLHEKETKLSSLAATCNILEKKAVALRNQQERQDRIWHSAQKSSHLYLSEKVEKLSLLTPELQRVKALAQQYPENRSLQERLAFLNGEKNRIRFDHVTEKTGPLFREIELKFNHPVQMNDDDLRQFLTTVESHNLDPIPEKPLFVIKEFDLIKQKEKADETVYTIQAEIIQREPKNMTGE